MKYLFTAQFNDGSAFAQDYDDKHPANPTASSFTHLLEEEKVHGGVAVFSLENDVMRYCRDNGTSDSFLRKQGHTYSVDLRDGHFEIDGLPFTTHDASVPLKDMRLIYYRTHTVEYSGTDEANHDIAFVIGWQANDPKGKNVQQTIQIN